MNEKMRKICWVLSAALLSGCVHATAARNDAPPAPAAATEAKQQKPELTAALVERAVVKGKTTREELVALLGAPNAVLPNRQRPSKELVAQAKGTLPPLAYTKEFWKYWSSPPQGEGAAQAKLFNVLVFLDDRGVAIDYLTADSRLALP